jgi:hypothetical protein
MASGRIVKAGDPVKVWSDFAGNPTAGPKDSSQIGAGAVAAALVSWLVIAALCAGVVLMARIVFDYQRGPLWDRELAQLVGSNDGWAARHH